MKCNNFISLPLPQPWPVHFHEGALIEPTLAYGMVFVVNICCCFFINYRPKNLEENRLVHMTARGVGTKDFLVRIVPGMSRRRSIAFNQGLLFIEKIGSRNQSGPIPHALNTID